ncbi:MAG: hypothetical protein ACR2NP_18805, partial [Pirellulaceae bacterium]
MNFRNTGVVVALGMASLIVGSPAYTQVADNPQHVHLRAGHFATPIELPGDVDRRKITSLEILCESLNANGGTGTLIIDDRAVVFNEFGDANVADSGELAHYEVSFLRIEEKTDPDARRGPGRTQANRSLYRLVFTDEFCTGEFCLNICHDGVTPPKLVQIDPDLRGGLRRDEPKIERVLQMHAMAPQETDPPGQQPVGDEISLSTTPLELTPGKLTAGITIRGALGGEGTFENDGNSCSYADYGDSGMQTLAGYPGSLIELVERTLQDSLQQGRRIFDVQCERGELLHLPDATGEIGVSIVWSKLIGQDHRLIIRCDEQIIRVLPLVDTKWQQYARQLAELKTEESQR